MVVKETSSDGYIYISKFLIIKWSPDEVSMIKLLLLKCLCCKRAAMRKQVEQRPLHFFPG